MQSGLGLRAQSEAVFVVTLDPQQSAFSAPLLARSGAVLSGLCRAERRSLQLWSPFQPGPGDGSTFPGRRPMRCAAPQCPPPTHRLGSPTGCLHPSVLRGKWSHVTLLTSLRLLPGTNLMFFFKFCVCEIKQTYGNRTWKYRPV